MSLTKLENLINPLVIADMIATELPYKLQATGFIRVDTTLTGRAGNTIMVPSYRYIGMADVIPEGDCAVPVKLTTEELKYTIKKIGKAVQLTDEAVLSGYGDPVTEAKNQIVMACRDRIDEDAVVLLDEITPLSESREGQHGLVYDGSASALSYNHIVEGLDLLGLETQNDEQLYLLVNKKGLKQLRKDAQITESFVGSGTIFTGTIQTIAGCKIVVSNKVREGRAYILTKDALTAFIKRDVDVETERNALCFNTTIVGSAFYVTAIEDYSKIAVVLYKA